jgi:monothiol glutaredoxin
MGKSVEEEVNEEIKKHKILVYGKGTKATPMCGFTVETIQFFSKYGYPFEIIDVLNNMDKRNYLTKLTNWPTLPKVFINGKFYGDTDVLGPMEQKGELQALLKEVFKER